jgi:hypothetical protein
MEHGTRTDEPPMLLFIYRALLVLDIQRGTQGLIYEVYESVLGVIRDRGGNVDIKVRLLEENVISEREFESIPFFFSAGGAGT